MSGERIQRPNRRAIEITDFEYDDGQRYTAAISQFQNGKIAEIFLTCGKFGAAIHMHAQDSAILCSLALQSGTPVATIRHAVKGPVGYALSLFEVKR